MTSTLDTVKALHVAHKILIGGAACALLALLFPPYYVRWINGVVFNMGYSWIFDPPMRGSITASIDVPIVLLELVVIAIVTGVAWFIARKH